MKYLLAYSFFACICMAGRGQNLSVVNYNTPQGLADPVVYRAMQDSRGVLWFSTDNGISRFDGINFKTFSIKDGLKTSFIFTIVEVGNQLLLSTYGQGIQFFDGVKGLPGNHHNHLIQFPIDLVAWNNGLFVIDKNTSYYLIKNNQVKKFSYPLRYQKNYLSKLVVHNQSLWGFHRGIVKFNTASGEFDNYSTQTWLDSANIHNAVVLPQGGFLLCTSKGLIHLDPQNQPHTLVPKPFPNRSGNMLLLKNHCILLQEPDGGLYLYEANLRSKKQLLSGITINDMLEDRDGNIWLCTYGKGVLKISHTGILSFPINNVVNPLLFFDENTRQLRIFSYQSGSFALTAGSQGLLLKKDPVTTNITAGYNRPGNTPVFYSSNSILHYRGNSPQAVAKIGQTISHISMDAEKQYWVGAKPGLHKGPGLEKLKELEFFHTKIVRCAVHKPNGDHFIGADDGLYLIQHTNPAAPQKLPLPEGTLVVALHWQEERNRIWIGTNNGLYSLEQDQLKTWIPELVVHKIITDKNQHTWFATHLGLMGYNNRYFKLLNAENGFQSNIRDLAYDAATDRLYVLAPDQLLLAPATGLLTPEPPAANNIYIVQQRTDEFALNSLNTNFDLPGQTKSIALEYVAPFFNNKQAYALYYRMNGGAWVNTNWSNYINAVNLRKGKNELELKLADELNNTITARHKITYNIPIPVWQRPWFIAALSILFTLLLLFSMARIRFFLMRKKRKALAEKREKTELEHKVLSNMLNPHFMNNALTAIQSFVARNDQRNTLAYLSKFGRLMRINLELLEKNSIPLAKELQNLTLYLDFEQLRHPELIQYSIEVSERTDIEKIMVPSLLLQPFVENAIWHGILPKGSPGHINISVNTRQNLLEILIRDDGIGLAAAKEAQKHTRLEKPSRGLQIISDRLRLLNLEKSGHGFELFDNQPRGACVRICIPL